jgi:hypothetical protein
MVAFLDAGNACADVNHYACAFVTENAGKQTFRVCTGKRELIGMTKPSGLDFNQYLARARAIELNSFDTERLACFEGDSGTDIH